jgi:hypothetical protein
VDRRSILLLAARVAWIYIKIAAVVVMLGNGAPKFIYGGF